MQALAVATTAWWRIAADRAYQYCDIATRKSRCALNFAQSKLDTGTAHCRRDTVVSLATFNANAECQTHPSG
jgi:hypothetical protein